MIIKVCGLREAENIRAIAEMGVDMIGLIFWPKSKRFVDMLPSHTGLLPDRAGDIPSKGVKKVGVFVDEMPQNIVTRAYNFRLDYIQLHGNESPTMIRNLRATLDPDICPGIKIIKAISVASAADIAQCQQYADCVDMFLFDTKCEGVGGSGTKFAWDVLGHYDGSVPFLLSGGLGPDDIDSIRHFTHPMFAGIDLNSRFELSPGLKDTDLLAQFVQAIRQDA